MKGSGRFPGLRAPFGALSPSQPANAGKWLSEKAYRPVTVAGPRRIRTGFPFTLRTSGFRRPQAPEPLWL